MSKIINKNKPKVLDLFSGAGGSGLGFKETGFEIIGAIEIDQYCNETYEKNICVKVTQKDIRKINPKAYREELRITKRQLDVLVGCPPCQGFSRMRNDNGKNDKRNDLVNRYIDYVKEFMPRFALFENVPGIIRKKHGKVYYNKLIRGLKELNYHVIEKEENLANYGVPQRRKRVIVIAGRDGEIPPYPAPTHFSAKSKEAKSEKYSKYVTVKEAIGNGKYPKIKAGENGEKNGKYPNHIAPRTTERVLEFIKHVPKDGGSRKDIPKEFWLDCHLKHHGHSDVYGRIAWDKPSNTITTGCTNVSKGRFVHPEQNRAITYREAATLQGFPDSFIFYGKNIASQIGNAVPPPLAKAIAKCIFNQINS